MNNKPSHNDVKRNVAMLKEQVKELIDPTTLMVALGFSIYKDNDLEVRAPCILHSGDNKTAFQLKKSSKRFRCYTHRCECGSGGSLDNDVISLVRKARNCSFEEALSFLASLCGISYDPDGFNTSPKEIDTLLNKKNMSFFVAIQDYLDGNSEIFDSDEIMEAHMNGAEYFKSRGVSDRIISEYVLGTYTDPVGETRAMVPIRNDLGNFVAFSGRRVIENSHSKKYDIRPIGFKKGLVLYNLDRALTVPKSKKFIIIVEGFRAAWHMIECGFENVVAVMGSKLSESQVSLLSKYGLLNVLLFFDWDESGIDGTKRSISLLKKYGSMKYKAVLPMSDYFNGASQPDHLTCNQMYEVMSLYY